MNDFVAQGFSYKIFLSYFNHGVLVTPFCSNCFYTQWIKKSNSSKIWVCRLHKAMLYVTSNT